VVRAESVAAPQSESAEEVPPAHDFRPGGPAAADATPAVESRPAVAVEEETARVAVPVDYQPAAASQAETARAPEALPAAASQAGPSAEAGPAVVPGTEAAPAVGAGEIPCSAPEAVSAKAGSDVVDPPPVRESRPLVAPWMGRESAPGSDSAFPAEVVERVAVTGSPRRPALAAGVDPAPSPVTPEVPRVVEPPAPEEEQPGPETEFPAFMNGPAPRRSLAWLYWLLIACATVGAAYTTRDRWMGPSSRPSASEVASAGRQPPAVVVKAAPPQEAPIPGSAAPAGPAGSPTTAVASAATGPVAAVPAVPAAVPAKAEPSVPALPSSAAPALPAPPPSAALTATDVQGQLQIRWDRTAPAVLQGQKAVLEITDGVAKSAVPLDRDRLRAGNFNYARRSERVDVRLTIDNGRGGRLQDYTIFLGKLPDRNPPGDAWLKKQRDDLALEAARLKVELATQSERARKAERALEDLQKQVKREQQLRRLENQTAATH